MEKVEYNELSNGDLRIMRTNLENKYEKVKSEISKLYDELESLEKDYASITNELIKRGIE